MMTPSDALAIALGHYRAGQLALAEAVCQEALAREPDDVMCLRLLGLIALRCGRSGEAVDWIERMLALEPDDAEGHSNLAVALQREGALDRAVPHWERAVALKPDYAEAHCNLGAALSELGKLEEAAAHHRRALALKPGYAEAHCNLGLVLAKQQKLDEAIARYEQALALKPDYAEAHLNFGLALQWQGRRDDAVTRYEQALALRPDYAETQAGLDPDNLTCFGLAFYKQGNLDKAIACYARALAIDPDHLEAHLNYGIALEQQVRVDDAIAHYERALALKPDFGEVRFRLCTAQLPILYHDDAEIPRRRSAYRARLDRLSDDFDQRRAGGDLAKAVGSSQPFYLAYQGCNDRDLQSLYGGLVCRMMAERFPAPEMPSPPALDDKVRVGIFSGFYRRHSNWKIPIKGWVSRLDRQKFELFGYHSGAERDAETEAAAALFDSFVQGPLTLERWRETILTDAPHVLIYPEIGMDPASAQLAALRLARVQCTSWGHPTTSGYPTLDYFLSSALMEPPDGQDHYTERLVRLPNLSIYYEPIATEPVALDRAELGLRPGATVYWCGQSLFKYLPRFDQVFARIAREVGECQFAFIQHHDSSAITELLRERLARAFAGFGLDAAEYCAFLPRLDLDQFVAAIGLCDIVLDSIGWSGCNSTLEGLAHDVPIVTMPGPLMRGRHTVAILRMMGLTETIAETTDEYVSLAVRLALDAPWRQAVRRRMADNKHRVYRDRACISALEEFLCRVARAAGGNDDPCACAGS
jgi:predicted O-linked N-acetylglucosamine transferase (SPINDLY family)